MSAWEHLYQFWISEQGLAGGLVGDIIIGLATYGVGKYKVAPWLHRHHEEHLAQSERQHREILAEHRALYELHERQHRELLEADRQPPSTPIRTSPAPSSDGTAVLDR